MQRLREKSRSVTKLKKLSSKLPVIELRVKINIK